MANPLKMLGEAITGQTAGHMHREELIAATNASTEADKAASPPSQPPAAGPPTTPSTAPSAGQPSFVSGAAVATPQQQNTAQKTLLGQ